jgi:hypothetical protein
MQFFYIFYSNNRCAVGSLVFIWKTHLKLNHFLEHQNFIILALLSLRNSIITLY